MWGSGEEERDLLYINDLVEFVKELSNIRKMDLSCTIADQAKRYRFMIL